MVRKTGTEPDERRGDRTPCGLAETAAAWDSGDRGKTQFAAVMQAAERSGLLGGKSGRIGGRVSPALVAQAKRRTGIESDTDLIAFALASIALEDDFAETFEHSRGKVDPGLKLGF